ncbi:MAG: hypothetical protein P4L50_06930 [Anaerolineaceae bacterium]|nr:hypothetical protein [Anaerolineaceae bacterium]
MTDETIIANQPASTSGSEQTQTNVVSLAQTQQSSSDATQPSQPNSATVPPAPSAESKQPDNLQQSSSTPPADPATKTEANVPATNSPTSTSTTDASVDCTAGSLNLIVRDWHNDPIPHMELRVLDITQRSVRDTSTSTPDKFPTIFSGKTNGKGQIPIINNLKLGTRFEVQIKKDSGEFTLGGIGTISSSENTACLKSPKVKFEISTYAHEGTSGTADTHKEQVADSHNQVPDAKPNVSRNPPDVKPQIKPDRNSDGNPKAVVKDSLPNMWGQHANQVAAPNAGTTDLEKVKALIDFATEQAGWTHTGDTSAAIIEKMKAGTYEKAGTKGANGYQNSIYKCTKYVKIALWKAGYSHNNGDIAPSEALARNMGPHLEDAGFKNVTGNLPDARWAAPGDIIVYQRLGAPVEAGHIDIRTYDGYISDFIETYLPLSQFRVIGIYRKFYDPLPEKRMRAFLKVIRTRETGLRIPDDVTRYRALPDPGISHTDPPLFDSFDTHPFDGKELKKGERTTSGAYQITLSTWKSMTKTPGLWVPLPQNEQKFSPTVQDRIAIAIMDLFPSYGYTSNGGQSALGLVRKGEIEAAAKILAQGDPTHHGTAQWTSLPGGKESKYTVGEMMADYQKFLGEQQQ